MTEKEVSRIIARFLALENGWIVMPFFKMGKRGEEACMWGRSLYHFFKVGFTEV